MFDEHVWFMGAGRDLWADVVVSTLSQQALLSNPITCCSQLEHSSCLSAPVMTDMILCDNILA